MREDIRVFDSLEALSENAAALFDGYCRSAVEARGGFRAALSGGATPLPLFSLLGSGYRERILWNRTDIFWTDERCVPPDHKDSNFKAAFDSFLSRVTIPDENVHRIFGELRPEEAAERYEQELKRAFGATVPVFDLIVLGIGEDGHVASLFPGDNALEEKERLAVPAFSQRAGNWRVTLTLDVLNSAAHIIVLAAGNRKAGVVGRILASRDGRGGCPAGRVRPENGIITWLLDTDAAADLGRLAG